MLNAKCLIIKAFAFWLHSFDAFCNVESSAKRSGGSPGPVGAVGSGRFTLLVLLNNDTVQYRIEIITLLFKCYTVFHFYKSAP